MGLIVCLVGAAGALIAILLIVIMCIAGKKAYAPLGLFAICVVVMLVSGILPTSSTAVTPKVNRTSMPPTIQSPESQSFEDKVPAADVGKSVDNRENDGIYKIGDTWTVPGQWSVTVTGVSETNDRNPYSDKMPESVYILDYTYTNLGYEKENFDGVFISLVDLGAIVDSNGMMGYSYPGDISKHAVETPVGATCTAQNCIGVDNAGDFKIIYSMYDGENNRQTANFEIDVG